MSSKSFVVLFIAAQLLLIVTHIYKHSKKIDLLYSAQKHQLHHERLLVQRQHLMHQLTEHTDRARVAQYASDTLQMKPMQITQVKRIKEQNDADSL